LWRVQQIGVIASLSLLALNLSLTVNQYIEWRFSNSYIGTGIVLVLAAFAIWCTGFVWDRGFKLWKEQTIVSIERNPYSTIHLTPKEVVLYTTMWIPWLRESNLTKQADYWQRVVDFNLSSDEKLRNSVSEMMAL